MLSHPEICEEAIKHIPKLGGFVLACNDADFSNHIFFIFQYFELFSCIFDIVKIQSFLHRSTLNIFAEVDDLFDNVDQYFSNFLESFVFVSVFVFVFFHVLL